MGICKVKDDNIVQAMQQVQAEQARRDYDAANFRDAQFDLADALVTIAISLLAVTALTHLWWLTLLPWYLPRLVYRWAWRGCWAGALIRLR